MLRKIYLFVVGLLVCSLNSFAQNASGGIKVTLKDKGNNEAIPFANVVAYQNGVQVGVGTTDMEGECIIKPLAPGKYDVKGVYVGYQAQEYKGVLVGEGKTAYVTIALSNGEGVKLDEVEIVTYQVPLIDPDMKQGQTVDREQYQNMATKDVNSVAATTAGVFQADEGGAVQVRGGRDGATTYFIDGIKVVGGLSGLPQQSIEQINVITGGLPAQYGDATSGVISVTTRGPQSKFGGGVELISSQLTDAYGYNSLGFSLGGPILTKTDSNGVKNTMLGFFISGQGTYQKDPDPSYIPIHKMNDEKLKEIQETPLVAAQAGDGFNYQLGYVTKDDFTTQKARQNVADRNISVNGKIDWKAAKNTNVTIGGAYDYNNKHEYTYVYSLFNAENNPQVIGNKWRTYLRITQKFGTSSANSTDKEKDQAIVKNAFFSFLASYDKTSHLRQDDTHKDRYFDYGYIGKFNRTFSERENIFNYQFNPKLVVGNDTVKAWEYFGRTENLTTFEASDLNYNMARYTSYLQDYYGGVLPPFLFISGTGGLVNGDRPLSIYNLFAATGRQYGGSDKNNTSQFRIATSFNADVKDHALTVGMEFDQREERGWNVSTQPIWGRARQLANNHTQNLDKDNPILVPELSGTYPAYFYNYQYDAENQSKFSVKLLEKLGLPKDNTSFINIDEMDPSMFTLDMFSAEDFLGQGAGSTLGDYYGYDHTGKKTTSSTNLNEFLNKKDELGYNMFPVGAYKPIYMAGYIQDKFDLKDIKFNVGLRVDRFDANQKTLKDPYSIYTTRTAGETTDEFDHPGNIGSDYVVYTSAYDGGSIVGYRDGDQWYNSKGEEVSDPGSLVSTGGTGKVTPYLTEESIRLYNDGTPFNVNAFQNYKAQVNFMPRIAFSFPISDVANFFAHYDVLTRRPPSGGFNRFDPKDYYFLETQSSAPFLANSALKPERTVDYELGFNQILNERKNAALKFSAFYREMRDMLTLKQVTSAFPRTYNTYVNQDFGTVKGMSIEFDMRRTGGSRINANYTLQFAEGSGSNANSGVNLALSGQPNLRITQPLDYDQRHAFVLTYDYRFGTGKDYKGPKMKRKKDGNDIQLLQDVGFNLQFLIGSGTPYTRNNAPVGIGSFGQRSTILGSVNGSNKPWNFRSNLRIDKTVELTWGKDDNKKKANLNIYLQILNLFNTMNIADVYAYTGNPNDDGFLSSPLAQSTLQGALSAQAYTDQYTIYMNNPANYNRPRVIRIGLQLDF